MNRNPNWLTHEQQIFAWETAVQKLIDNKNNHEKLHDLLEQLDEHGPAGPVGLGLDKFGGHAVGE